MVKRGFSVENARLLFRNFTGVGGQYNAVGHRNFSVVLEHVVAEQLEADGWNVRYLKPKDPEEQPTPYIQVKVSFDNQPPKIVLISGRGKTLLNEDTVNLLDWAEIGHVDLSVNPYNWSVSGKSGVKAYLKSLYVTIVEDEFESKYYDVPDSGGAGSIGGCGGCETCSGDCGCNGH